MDTFLVKYISIIHIEWVLCIRYSTEITEKISLIELCQPSVQVFEIKFIKRKLRINVMVCLIADELTCYGKRSNEKFIIII